MDEKNVKLKFKLHIEYLDGSTELKYDLDGVRFTDTAISYISGKILGMDLYKNQTIVPFSAVKKIESEITDIIEAE